MSVENKVDIKGQLMIRYINKQDSPIAHFFFSKLLTF